MKKLKQFTSVLLLSLIFIPSAFAGEIGLPAPSPATPTASAASTPGEIWIPGAATESVVIEALNLLKDLLLVF